MGEPVKHTEWVLGITFLGYAGINILFLIDKSLELGLVFVHSPIYMSLYTLLGIIIGSQFPDILENILKTRSLNLFSRRLSHTVIIPISISVVSVLIFYINSQSFSFDFIPILFFPIFLELTTSITLGILLHLIIDLFAGGEPVYLLSPFSNKGAFVFINKDQRLRIGQIIETALGDYVLASSKTENDLAWFWLLQLIGTTIGIVGFACYLLIPILPL